MRCPVCYMQVPEGGRFCPHCGASLAPLGDINPAVMALVEQYERRITEHPEDASARFNLALAYLKVRQYGAAFQQLERVCRLEPDFPDAFYWLALVSRKVGNTELFQESVAMLRRLAHRDEKARSLLTRLRRLLETGG